jgi:hypothetical protein
MWTRWPAFGHVGRVQVRQHSSHLRIATLYGLLRCCQHFTNIGARHSCARPPRPHIVWRAVIAAGNALECGWDSRALLPHTVNGLFHPSAPIAFFFQPWNMKLRSHQCSRVRKPSCTQLCARRYTSTCGGHKRRAPSDTCNVHVTTRDGSTLQQVTYRMYVS